MLTDWITRHAVVSRDPWNPRQGFRSLCERRTANDQRRTAKRRLFGQKIRGQQWRPSRHPQPRLPGSVV